jgi:hypothetical protein
MSAQCSCGDDSGYFGKNIESDECGSVTYHYSMKQELKLLKEIIRDYTPDEYSYEPEEGTP